jgi:hypothetical protein
VDVKQDDKTHYIAKQVKDPELGSQLPPYKDVDGKHEIKWSLGPVVVRLILEFRSQHHRSNL